MSRPEELRLLEEAGVRFTVRKPESAPPADAVEGERDVAVARADVARLDAALTSAGWERIDARERAHVFYLKVRDGRWTKLDVKVEPPRRMVLPVTLRRRGPIVAVLGPDGAGKSTLTSELVARIPLGVRVAYLGRGTGGRRGPRPPRSAARQTAGVVKEAVRTATALAREHWAARRGSIVLCDRHPKELLAVRPARPRGAALIERFIARRLFPAPDAYVVLEAPADVLHSRKPEHPVERVERWLAAYREELAPRGATFVDTSGDQDDSLAAVSEAVWRALVRRQRR